MLRRMGMGDNNGIKKCDWYKGLVRKRRHKHDTQKGGEEEEKTCVGEYQGDERRGRGARRRVASRYAASLNLTRSPENDEKLTRRFLLHDAGGPGVYARAVGALGVSRQTWGQVEVRKRRAQPWRLTGEHPMLTRPL